MHAHTDTRVTTSVMCNVKTKTHVYTYNELLACTATK